MSNLYITNQLTKSMISKESILNLIKEYKKRLEEFDESIEYYRNEKMSNSQDHVAGKYYELEKVVNDLERLLK